MTKPEVLGRHSEYKDLTVIRMEQGYLYKRKHIIQKYPIKNKNWSYKL